MNEANQGPARTSGQAANPPREPWLPWAVALVAVAIAVAVWFSAGRGGTAAPQPGPGLAKLQQDIATLRQSDRISRQAMLDLQNTLTERDEQIAALRADLDFYERFVSPDRQRRGLSVHAAHVRPQAANVWRFEVTLTQGREQAAASRGKVEVRVEGSRDGKLTQLDWDALRQRPDAPGIDYGLRYLQRVEGEFALPAGFVPTRLVVRLLPSRGQSVETAFNWNEIAGA
ncbi:DUF6776 family protein [Solilutibacter pythonis]|nr:DUF6776 family protein [Lysobacter pythonis]